MFAKIRDQQKCLVCPCLTSNLLIPDATLGKFLYPTREWPKPCGCLVHTDIVKAIFGCQPILSVKLLLVRPIRRSQPFILSLTRALPNRKSYILHE